MLCSKRLIYSFFFFLFVFLLPLFISSSSYATSQSFTCSYSDFTTNCRKPFDSSIVGFTFTYVSIEVVGSDFANVSKNLGVLYTLSPNSVNEYGIFDSSGYLFQSFNVVDSYFYPSSRTNLTTTTFTSYTITFYDSMPIAPCSCPDPDPCPEVPENPYDDKLDQLIKAVYYVPAVLLVIYFFYVMYSWYIRR